MCVLIDCINSDAHMKIWHKTDGLSSICFDFAASQKMKLNFRKKNNFLFFAAVKI